MTMGQYGVLGYFIGLVVGVFLGWIIFREGRTP